MAIPLSRGEIDFAEGQSKTLGMTPVDKEIIPPPTADYTPFATKLKDADANWVFSWAPWVTQVRTFEALRRLGWNGDYIAWAHLEAEGELARIKDPQVLRDRRQCAVPGQPADPQGDRARPRKKAGRKYPPEQMAEGWIAGMVIEAVLKGAGWPATPAKVRGAMAEPEGRHQGPARRADRMDQGQPLPHPAVLPRLPLGRRARSRVVQGLDGLRREVTPSTTQLPAHRRRAGARAVDISVRTDPCSSPSTSWCWRRSTR